MKIQQLALVLSIACILAAYGVRCAAIDDPVSGSCGSDVVVRYSFSGDSTIYVGITNFATTTGFLACNSSGLYYASSYRPLSPLDADCKFTSTACGLLLNVEGSYFLDSSAAPSTTDHSSTTSSANKRRMPWW